MVTTLNIQHLEGLGDTVLRLTGTTVRETLPDGILSLADEVILIDVTPDTLRQRLRDGKIYPAREDRDRTVQLLPHGKPVRAARVGVARSVARTLSRANIVAVRTPAAQRRVAQYRPFDDHARGTYRRPPGDRLCDRARRRAERESRCCGRSKRCAPKHGNPTSNGSKRLPKTCPENSWRSRERNRKRRSPWPGRNRKPRFLAPSSFARRLLDAGARELLVLMRPESSSEDVARRLTVEREVEIEHVNVRLAEKSKTRGPARETPPVR